MGLYARQEQVRYWLARTPHLTFLCVFSGVLYTCSTDGCRSSAASFRIKSFRPPDSHQNLKFLTRNRRGRGKLQPDLRLHTALHNPQRHHVAKSPHRTHTNAVCCEWIERTVGHLSLRKFRLLTTYREVIFLLIFVEPFSSDDKGRPQRCWSEFLSHHRQQQQTK